MRALSFHIMLTTSHKPTPKIDDVKSTITSSGIPLTAIDVSIKALATHLRYQSIVYLGVADLNILLEFAISSLEISLGFFSFNIIVYLFPISNNLKVAFLI